MRYRVNEFEFDLGKFRLSRGDATVRVEPLIFDLLKCLILKAGDVVSRDQMIAEVWAGRIVSEATISSAVKAARRALGDSGDRQEYIRTVRARGFQFVAPVTPIDDEIRPSAPASGEAPKAPPPEPQAEPRLEPLKVASAPPRIAVLPFVALESDEALKVIGDAIAQEVILELARLHSMFVTARGSSFQFRGLSIDFSKLRQSLRVDYAVTGAIARRSANYVVTVELASVPDGSILWSDRFDVPADDIVQLRSVLAGRIAYSVEPNVQHNEARAAARLPTGSLDAWAAYHLGLSHLYRFNRRDNERAAHLFGEAVAQDPQFARAYAGLSFAHHQNALLGYTPDIDAERREARAMAERCVEIDPFDPFVNLTMGRSEWIGGDLEAGLGWMQRSIDLSPNYAFALYNSALVGTLLGEGATNEERVAKAIELSPIDPLNYAMLGTRALTYVVRGDFEEAAKWAERAAQAPSAHAQIFAIAAFASELSGAPMRARSHVERLKRRNPDFAADDFFSSFQMQPGPVRAQVAASLGRLGL